MEKKITLGTKKKKNRRIVNHKRKKRCGGCPWEEGKNKDKRKGEREKKKDIIGFGSG